MLCSSLCVLVEDTLCVVEYITHLHSLINVQNSAWCPQRLAEAEQLYTPFSSCPVISTLIALLPVCILINGFGNTLKRIPLLSSPKLFRQGDDAGSRT